MACAAYTSQYLSSLIYRKLTCDTLHPKTCSTFFFVLLVIDIIVWNLHIIWVYYICRLTYILWNNCHWIYMYENNRQKALIYVTNICGYFKTEKKSWYMDARWLSETPDIKRNQGSPWWKRYVSIWNQRNIKTNCWFPNRRKRGSWCKKDWFIKQLQDNQLALTKG